MICNSCKVGGHTKLTECEMCEEWYCAKCQNLKADIVNLLKTNCKSIHWFCNDCEPNAMGAVTNTK